MVQDGGQPDTRHEEAEETLNSSWDQDSGLFVNGMEIAERYRVIRFIARGGIGEVYEVEDLQLGGRLALKTLQPLIVRREEARERFRREIQLARRVTHRHVCRIYEAGLHYGPGLPAQPFLTMELLNGESLEERILRAGPLGPTEALPLIRQMAAGLDAAHAEGVVHRDFKAGNVMLEPVADGDVRVVVTDFGLARAFDDGGEGVFKTLDTEGISGTLAYMAPEQLRDQELSAATDIYALGVVLFQMVTGRVPFQPKLSLGSLLKLMQEEAPSPRSLAPHLNGRWDAVILKCLEKRPEDRFSSGAEVVAALEGQSWVVIPSQARRRMTLLAMAGLLVWAAALWLGRRQAPAVERIEAGDPQQLTADVGLEIDPSFSSDGSLLAYSSNRAGGFDIYLHAMVPGGQDRRLTFDHGRNVQPVPAPDLSGIAFVRQVPGGIWWLPLAPTSSESAGPPAARPDEIRRLTMFGSRPAWSPDGRWLAFQGDARKEISERTLAALPPSTLWRVPASGGEAERLTRVGHPVGGHGEPAWSPDGRWVAFSAGNRSQTRIWGVEVETGRVETLVSDTQVSVNPVFSADGRGLFYVGISRQSSLTATFAIWRQGLDPESGMPVGKPSNITRLGLANIRQMSLSPRGDRLVYAALSTVSGLHQLALDERGQPVGSPLAWPRSGQRNSRPQFSKDGRRVAFDRWQIGRNLDLWVRDLAIDQSPRQVTVDPAWDSQASWLNDGTLSYLSERQGLRGVWHLDLDSGEHSLVARIGGDADWARLSPDGRRIAFHSSEDSVTLDIWLLDVATGKRRRLTRDHQLAGYPTWSPNGSLLALEIQRGESTQVAVIDLETMGPEGSEAMAEIQTLTFEEGDSWPYSWSADNDRIAFAGRRDGFWNLYWVSISSGQVTRLTDQRDLDGYLRYPAWSPDGSLIVYEQAQTVGDLWQVDLTRH